MQAANPDLSEEEIEKFLAHSIRVWAPVLLSEASRNPYFIKSWFHWMRESHRTYLRDTDKITTQHCDVLRQLLPRSWNYWQQIWASFSSQERHQRIMTWANTRKSLIECFLIKFIHPYENYSLHIGYSHVFFRQFYPTDLEPTKIILVKYVLIYSPMRTFNILMISPCSSHNSFLTIQTTDFFQSTHSISPSLPSEQFWEVSFLAGLLMDTLST